MGLLTSDQIEEEIRGHLENESGLGDTFLNRRLNEAYRHVSHPKIFSHPGLQDDEDVTLVAATSSYALPADLFSIESVFFITSSGQEQRLRRADFSRLLEDRNINTNSSGGQPSRYSRRGTRGSSGGGKIYFDVNPSSNFVGRVVRVYYWARPAEISGASPTEIDSLWDKPITLLAASFGWARLNQSERADYYRQLAADLINDYGENLDYDAIDPTEGFEIESSSLRYSEVSR